MGGWARRLGEEALVVGALILATGAGCTRPDPREPPPLPTPAKVDQDILAGGFRDCYVADCERAYAHVSMLAATSPLRQTPEFRAIRYRYDADRLLHVDIEPDLSKRRALLASIAESPVSDPFIRLNATERISRLGIQGGAHEVSLNADLGAASPTAVAAAETEDLAKMAESKMPADQAAVRARIEPKVFGGKATATDVAILRTVCKAQHDTACLRQLEKLILP